MGIRRSAGVSYEPSGDRVMILDADAKEMTTLNPVGSRIWNELDGERDSAALARDLVSELEGVDEDTLRGDIEEFVATLVESGLAESD